MLAQITETSTSDSTAWVLIGLGAALLVYLVIRPTLRKPRDGSSASSSSPFRLSLSQQRQLERDMQNVLVEMSQMVRDLQSQIDTRSTKLDLLIREADGKIEQLRRLEASRPASVDEPAPAEVVLRLPKPTEPNIEPVGRRHAEIYELSDQGLDARAIASKLDRPTGEVELILALRPRPARAG